ncbi:hypothetical protein Lpp78_06833 [Lacticaseibacillus paracasei subsp. paracasei CNCM I-2877]|nr:hypothetical protein Lpp78_06833 [Lacticaseibacillus paracasei subsp. paracasei CNCM I-2877]
MTFKTSPLLVVPVYNYIVRVGKQNFNWYRAFENEFIAKILRKDVSCHKMNSRLCIFYLLLERYPLMQVAIFEDEVVFGG